MNYLLISVPLTILSLHLLNGYDVIDSKKKKNKENSIVNTKPSKNPINLFVMHAHKETISG